jgi:site-specific DNA recombinase
MDNFKVDLYIRVSTERQVNEGDSLDEQENELRKYCDFRRFQINNVFIERGKSGKNTNRPEYQKLIKDILDKKVNAVVVKRLDRLSRSLLDFEQLMKTMQENNVEFISICESFDTTTAMGKAMLRIALVFAQLEREQTSERLSDVMEYRASKGLFNGGHKPYGYTNVNKELVPYKKEKEVVEIIFDKFIETKSTTATARILNEADLKNRDSKLWDKRTVQYILQNTRYIGQIIWGNQIYEGIHEPLISKDKFQKAQDIFNKNKGISESPRTKAILQKVLFCGLCSRPLTPSHSLNRNKVKYYYYRCTSTHNSEKGKSKCQIKYVPFQKVEKDLLDILLSLANEEQFRTLENRILKHNQQIEQEEQLIQKEILLLESELKAVKEKKDKYLDSLISNKFLSKERVLITDKINELELEEKQTKGKILQKQFELSQKNECKINLSLFKMTLVSFKADYEAYSFDQLKEYIQENLQSIHYHPDKLVIKFKILPWELDFSTIQ